MYKINFALRTNYVKSNGECPLYIELSSDTEKKKLVSSVSVNKKHWHKSQKKVLNYAPDAVRKNNYLQNLLQKSYDFNLKNSVNNLNLSFQNYCDYVFDVKQPNVVENHSYIEFATNFYNFKKSEYSEGFYRLCICEISKLKQFVSDVDIENIDYKFLIDYEFYMRNKLNNKKNTVVKTFKRMKTVLNEAIRQNIIKKNPFTEYKLSYEKTNKSYLEIDELAKLENLYNDENLHISMKNVLQIFLFSCYTGLRFNDVVSLKKENIKDEQLNLIMHKTNELIIIPLTKKAKNILNDKEFVFYSNQRTNFYLKSISILTGINKHISFHTSRHTFATISLTIGIPIDVVSKLLGHNDLKTTQIYAKIVDKRKFDEMAKWNNL
jgi:integrase